MSNNTPRRRDAKTEVFRNAIEHRATWFYFLVEEAVKQGLNLHDFARKAIFKCGQYHAGCNFPQTRDLREFSKAFANENVVDAFEMEILEDSDKALSIDFHYCPLVAAWEKLTDDRELIAKMCDIAMDGDRGIISKFDGFTFDLGETIAKGDCACQIRIAKT